MTSILIHVYYSPASMRWHVNLRDDGGKRINHPKTLVAYASPEAAATGAIAAINDEFARRWEADRARKTVPENRCGFTEKTVRSQ